MKIKLGQKFKSFLRVNERQYFSLENWCLELELVVLQEHIDFTEWKRTEQNGLHPAQ